MADQPPTLDIPTPGDSSPTTPVEGTETMTESDVALLKLRIHESAAAAHARRTDGADAYAENLRYDYLEGKHNVSFMEGTGQRLVTEAGAGRTRAETNRPESTSAAGG